VLLNFYRKMQQNTKSGQQLFEEKKEKKVEEATDLLADFFVSLIDHKRRKNKK